MSSAVTTSRGSLCISILGQVYTTRLNRTTIVGSASLTVSTASYERKRPLHANAKPFR
jgi:hypothetical protein